MNRITRFFLPAFVSKFVFFPVWDIWDRSKKLREFRQLKRSQWQAKEEIESFQWSRFRALLDYAYQNSPYYQKLFNDAGITPADIQSREHLSLIPITKKADIRNNVNTFISKAFDRSQLETAKTGGSTGFSLELYFDKQCEEARNAAAMRSDQWAGWDMGKLRGDLWGNPILPTSLKQKIRSSCLDRAIFLDTMKLNSQTMTDFSTQIRQLGVKVIFGHAHSIFIFAKFVEAESVVVPVMDGIIATSMMLLDHERVVIERVFACKVTNRYGCEEVGLISSECDAHQAMHINVEHVLVEFVTDDGLPAPGGVPAKILVTDLNNHGMPLIRYQIEDMGAYSNDVCECGRGLPLMTEISGRVADFLKTKSGDSVSGISLIERTLTDIPGIEQMQLVQNSLDQLLVNRVKGKGFSSETDERLIKEFQVVFGDDMSVVIEDVVEIPQLNNGKYRFSICNI